MKEISGGTSTQNTNTQSTPVNPFTYQDLIDFTIPPLEDSLLEAGKQLNIINNLQTALRKYLEHAPWRNEGVEGEVVHRSASLESPIGEEFGLDFERRLSEHKRWMEEEGYAESTIKSRVYILLYWQKSWTKLLQSAELPDSFHAALKFLMERENVSPKQVAAWCGMKPATLYRWLDGSRMPSLSALKKVATIERGLKVQPGTLIYRLPSKLRGARSSVPETKNTPYRKYLSEIRRKPYRLRYNAFTPEQQREWENFSKFYTDPVWFAVHGLDRHPVGWRTRKNDNRNSTAEMKLLDSEKYYGFLSLPVSPADPDLQGVEFDPDNKSHVGVPGLDPQLTGMGLDPKQLSLALFTDVGLINEMIAFLRRRSFGNMHNTHTQVFLSMCAQLTRPEKGFLYQFPEYGKRLEQPILNKEEWQERCREAHKRINLIMNLIKNNRNKSERFNQTRDTTVEIVKPLIKEREHPLSVLTEIADGFRHDFKRASSAVEKAVLFRNLVMAEIVSSNPMRAINIAEMRYKVGAKGYEHEPTNLYKIKDGSFRLKYEEDELKNGATMGRYDLSVNPDLTKDLDEYFEVWRPLLVGAAECDFVFRPSPEILPSLLSYNADALTLAMTKSALSNIMRCASQTYVLPRCAGFGLHSARHFVATEYLKFNPGAYEIAGVILHDSQEMVKNTYSWVTPDDKIKFWNDHFSSVLREIRKEGRDVYA